MDLWTALEWLGRVLFVAFFIIAGITHFRDAKAIAGYAELKGIPAPMAAALVSGVLLLGGGILILIRWHPMIGAAALIVFLVPAAFMIHNYWAQTDRAMKAAEQAVFWRNIALAGAALLYIIAHHRGAW
jgi:putative oxidoreductase